MTKAAMRPRTAKVLCPLDQSSHPATASASDDDGSANGLSIWGRSDESPQEPSGVLCQRRYTKEASGTVRWLGLFHTNRFLLDGLG